METKVRENRIRRALERRGYRLAKSRRRDNRAADFGLYRIEDPYTNSVVAGSHRAAFSLTLDQVEAEMEGLERNWRHE